MKYMVKKIVALMLLLALFTVTGCDNKVESAENTVQVYLMALENFNLNALKDSLTEGTNEDMGIDTAIYESSFVQTDTYKKAVDTMYRALSSTIEFEIHGTEDAGDGVMLVDTTLKCADVNQQAVDEFMQARMDEYVQKHPEYEGKTELDKNNIGITVMAEAYSEFVQLQPKVSRNIKIAVTEVDDEWRVINGDINNDLKQWIRDMFGTF